MTKEEFTTWFKGFLDIEQPKSITKEQLVVIKDKLDEAYGIEKFKFISTCGTPNKPNKNNDIFSVKTIDEALADYKSAPIYTWWGHKEFDKYCRDDS